MEILNRSPYISCVVTCDTEFLQFRLTLHFFTVVCK
jgi:hypothetical protein